MNLKILSSAVVLAASFGLLACDDSSSPTSSPASSTGSQGQGGNQIIDSEPGNTVTDGDLNAAGEQPSCTVTVSANSVKTVQSVPGSGTYTSTVTKRDSRYVTIESEYWYADNQTAADECEDYKEEASHWLDGSMKVSCSGNKIVVNEVDEGSLQDHEADFRENCEKFNERFGSGSTSTGTTPTGSKDFVCNVSRTGNSVKIEQSYMGEAFEEMTSWTEDGAGRSVAVGVRTITFSDAEEAAEECADEKDEARYSDDESYQVQCTRNTVTVTKTVKNYDIDSYEAYYKAWCEDQQRRFKSGDIDKYL